MRFYPTALQRDLIKRHIGPFIFTFLTIMFLLLMQFLMLYIDKLVGKGIPTSIVLDLIFSNLAYMVVLAVPMAVLVSTLMAFGRFSELNEFTALKAGGVSPLKVILPLIYLSVLLSLALAWFSNYVLPEANYHARSLFIDIRMKKPGFDLKPNTFYNGISGYTFLVKRIDSQTDSLYDVTLFQEQNKNHDFAVIKSKEGYLKSEKDEETLTLYLYHGHLLRYLPQQVGQPKLTDVTNFKKYRISFDISQLAFSRSNPDR
ncbi:MAG TPA: LptF/LptG family permease, partial [Balneolales bacterium]|nr:LptF/LptG family permease [Balneolales bacterium]